MGMRKVVGVVLELGVLLITFGCATPNNVVYTPVKASLDLRARREPELVDIYLGKPPSRPHVEAGLFEVYQGTDADNSGRSTEDMFQTLRMHAGLRGCDAIQMLGVELAGRYYLRVIRAVCDIYVDDAGRQLTRALPPPARLPGEGDPCEPPMPTNDNIARSCQNPWICENYRCVSPYR
jgi:hypothetical protein